MFHKQSKESNLKSNLAYTAMFIGSFVLMYISMVAS
ncbi:hypothetical protein N781_11715 [Pontibacillus halophilus JSM 076056 = DSM 19796]|uniref:Uncharacterized protein n=1 Tax=Pontibacillus halophilus JSM 076056 = DSM 19796 TaxID=1385510 RepID=A0A0A5GQ68_9BACI|nr:hypothetical protein N781_11715 [Pontibacillus halophilus JSM 076056 = DSM 19796]